MQSGLCSELQRDVKQRFSEFASERKCGVANIVLEISILAETRKALGLIAMEDGIRPGIEWTRGKHRHLLTKSNDAQLTDLRETCAFPTQPRMLQHSTQNVCHACRTIVRRH